MPLSLLFVCELNLFHMTNDSSPRGPRFVVGPHILITSLPNIMLF
jgi:hypothetical protein